MTGLLTMVVTLTFGFLGGFACGLFAVACKTAQYELDDLLERRLEAKADREFCEQIGVRL